MKFLLSGAGFAAVMALMMGATSETHTERAAANLTRACIWKDGHSTQLSVSSSAGTGVLSQNSVYRVVCTVDVYAETGDSANPTADSNSALIPAKTVEYFSTGSSSQSRYFAAVDTAGASGTCHITECE